MHKKLEAELIHLAHQILKMNNTTNVSKLRDKARDIYENLSVLSFIDDYFIETPEVTGNKEDFLEEVNNLPANKIVNKKNIEEPVTIKKEVVPVVIKTKDKPQEKIEKEINPEKEKEQTEQLIQQTVKTIKSEAKEIVSKIQEEAIIKKEPTPSESPLDIEMKDSISADVAANMFERIDNNLSFDKSEILSPKKDKKIIIDEEAIKKNIEKTIEPKKVNIATKQEVHTPVSSSESNTTSLNDRINNQKIQVGLNDRIAFVKHLFNFSQEDFNRVLSQLNSFSTEQECKKFIINQVKLEYNWAGKEEYEDRLIALVERKFK